jgi:hypothetical protein
MSEGTKRAIISGVVTLAVAIVASILLPLWGVILISAVSGGILGWQGYTIIPALNERIGQNKFDWR